MRIDATPVYRAAHISEAAELASLSRLHIEHGLKWRWTPARVRAAIRDAETMVLVASFRGEIAGFAVMKFGEERAHLLLLAVLPAYRRCGIGSSLLQWLEKSCLTAGIRHVGLEVRAGNRVAREFYARAGYRYMGHVSGYYDRREAAAVMGKELGRTIARDTD